MPIAKYFFDNSTSILHVRLSAMIHFSITLQRENNTWPKVLILIDRTLFVQTTTNGFLSTENLVPNSLLKGRDRTRDSEWQAYLFQESLYIINWCSPYSRLIRIWTLVVRHFKFIKSKKTIFTCFRWYMAFWVFREFQCLDKKVKNYFREFYRVSQDFHEMWNRIQRSLRLTCSW